MPCERGDQHWWHSRQTAALVQADPPGPAAAAAAAQGRAFRPELRSDRPADARCEALRSDIMCRQRHFRWMYKPRQPDVLTTPQRRSKVHQRSMIRGMCSERAVRAFEAVLPPGTRVEVVAEEGRDTSVSLVGQRLRLRWLPVGWPRQLTEALKVKPRPDIVAAHQLSPGARALADRERVSWVDESGAAQIAAGNILISRSGSPILPLDSKVGWRPAALAVSEVVLTGCPPTVSTVVAQTGLAMSSVANALKFLADQGFLTGDADRGPHSGRHVAEWDGLLDAYAVAAERLRSPISIRAGVVWRNPLADIAEVGRLWDEASIKWAVTSALSAAAWAPIMTEVTPIEVYVDGKTQGDLRRTLFAVGLKEIEGGRLQLRPFPTPAGARVTTKITIGLRSVLWPRAYADLRIAGVRGEDAAEYLREEMSHAG
jgi:hypothetical protein